MFLIKHYTVVYGFKFSYLILKFLDRSYELFVDNPASYLKCMNHKKCFRTIKTMCPYSLCGHLEKSKLFTKCWVDDNYLSSNFQKTYPIRDEVDKARKQGGNVWVGA